MRRLSSAVLTATLVLGPVPSGAQQKAADPPRSAATFDASAIRRQAAQIAEFRSLLADPDPNVRLLTEREAIRAGDAVQRQVAIEVGLASNESAMVEVALRGVISNTQQIVFEYTDAEGKFVSTGIKLAVVQFETETGRISGISSCTQDNQKWSGQFQGLVFAFDSLRNTCSGSLTWVSESNDFRGRITIDEYGSKKFFNAVWKPR